MNQSLRCLHTNNTRDEVLTPHDQVIPPRDEVPLPHDEIVPPHDEQYAIDNIDTDHRPYAPSLCFFMASDIYIYIYIYILII